MSLSRYNQQWPAVKNLLLPPNLILMRAAQGNFGSHRERISGAVSELKLDYGPGYRVYFVRQGDTLVILLGGGTKASQEGDIMSAVALWERNKDDAKRFSREFRTTSE